MDTISSSSSLLGKAGSGSEEGGTGAYWVPSGCQRNQRMLPPPPPLKNQPSKSRLPGLGW